MTRGQDLLLVYRRPSSFIEIDRDLLSRHWRVVELPVSPTPTGQARAARATARADVVLGWFAGWHAAVPLGTAALLRRPSVMVVGGVDTANLPDIGYGFQTGGPRRLVSRWVMARATRLMTNSDYSRREIEENVGIPPQRVAVVHHGVPDPYRELPAAPREPLAVTVGVVDRRNLDRKGLRSFVAAAVHAPEVRWVLVGAHEEGAADELRARAGPNVILTGRVSDPERDDWLRRAGAYVQASRHEGFGMSVAEGMLAGCIPVVTAAGALPEVVGDEGEILPDNTPAAIAAGVRRALEAGEEARRRARERVLERFSLEQRERGLVAVVDAALGARGRRRPD
jgi:glycosyltransferase involved in cell wall biosynthesis